MEAEAAFQATSLTPISGQTIHRLAEFAPTTLALMHAPAYGGDCARARHDLGDAYGALVVQAIEPQPVA
jgi:hypothetical protein